MFLGVAGRYGIAHGQVVAVAVVTVARHGCEPSRREECRYVSHRHAGGV
jgi:hypothetical protein